MAVKFSAFTTRTGTLDASTRIVGYDDPAGTKTNVEFTLATLQANSGIYAANGTVTADATRTITMAGTANIVFTGGSDNSIQIGNLSAADGIGWKITPGTGGATASMTIADTNGVNIIHRYANGNNPLFNSGLISLGAASSDLTGTGAVAVNHPSNYNKNLDFLGASSQTTSLWTFAGNNTSGLTSFSTFTSTADDRYALMLKSYVNSNGAQNEKLFSVSASGLVEVGDATNTLSRMPNRSLKVNGQVYSVLNTITSGATITPDWADGNVQTVELTSASTTIADPSNIKVGATYMLILKQDGTGSRTVSFGSKYKFSGETAPTLATTANKADVITLVAYSANILMCTSVLDFVTS